LEKPSNPKASFLSIITSLNREYILNYPEELEDTLGFLIFSITILYLPADRDLESSVTILFEVRLQLVYE
jgi:hypothetical protein